MPQRPSSPGARRAGPQARKWRAVAGPSRSRASTRGAAAGEGSTHSERSPTAPTLPRALWLAAVLRDATLIGIGIDAYFGHPLAAAYPFSWFLERAQLAGADALRGVTSLLAIGSTPAAALLLLLHSLAGARIPRSLRLAAGAFAAVIGAGFLLTLLIYVLRAPWVLDWGKESLAAAVHLSILAHGIWLLRSSPPLRVSHLAPALVASVLWVGLVTLPQHPWLVVWTHTWIDWTTGNLPWAP